MLRPLPGQKNPYASLAALLDATRQLSPEELAELQLELGYVERALTIYEKLLLEDPKNPYLRGRCEWLARLAMARARETRRVGQATPAASPRARTGTRPGWASEPPPPPKRADSIVPRRIVPVR
ncbi:MAG: hypothetical protein R3B82_17120 [Sandaracinaceae bacterium]